MKVINLAAIAPLAARSHGAAQERRMVKLTRLGVVKNTFCPMSFSWNAIALVNQIPAPRRAETYKAIEAWQKFLRDEHVIDTHITFETCDGDN